MSSDSTPSRRAAARPWLTDGLLLGTAFAFAVTQPILDLLARQAEFLVTQQLRVAEMLWLVAAVGWLGPAILVAVMAVAHATSQRAAALVFGGAMAALAGAFFLQALKALAALPAITGDPSLSGGLLIGVAAALGLIFAWGVSRPSPWRTFHTFLIPAILLFPLIFVVRPAVRVLLTADRTSEHSLSDSVTIGSPVPIVIVVLDELPLASLLDADQEIDARRYPAFAAIAADSIWFRQATTVAKSTIHALPSIVTGRFPLEPYPIAALYPESVFTWLGGRYELEVFESFSQLCPDDLRGASAGEDRGPSPSRLRGTLTDLAVVYLHLLLPVEMAGGLPSITTTWGSFLDDETPEPESDGSESTASEGTASEGTASGPSAASSSDLRQIRGDVAEIFSRFLAAIGAHATGPDSDLSADRPVLYFLHLNLPHAPWKYLPSGREYGPPGSPRTVPGLEGPDWSEDDWLTLQGFQRHLLQVGYSDRLLGILLERLRTAGLFDPALVIVVADHGISFWPGEPRREVTPVTQADILRIPLFIKPPHHRGAEVSDKNVEIIDILPTIGEVIDSDLPWPVDGASALPLSETGRDHKTFFPDRRIFGPRIDGLEATLRRKIEAFGSGDPDRVFRLGDPGRLVGRSPEAFPAASSAAEIEIREPWSFEEVDLSGSYLPARLLGRYLGEPPADRRQLAIALNGKIRAVTRSFRRHDREELTAMLPEAAFRQGFNDLRVFEVRGTAEAPRLAPLSSRSEVRFTVVYGDDGRAVEIRSSDGRAFGVRRGSRGLRGTAINTGVELAGWAASLHSGQPAEFVLVFFDGEFVARVPILMPTPDLVRQYGRDSLAACGFRFGIPFGLIDPAVGRTSFFAVQGDVASPLPYQLQVSRKWERAVAGDQGGDEP